MDPVTQGALGAAAAVAIAPRARARSAALLGALAGMAPDLDVWIRSARDPLLFLEFHRQFTHALLFAPVGGLACAGAASLLARGRLRLREALPPCLAGIATHGLLDACTSYGTQLLWPLSDRRVAWNLVSVVDPLVTLPLLGLLAGAALARRPALARLALAWVALVLALGAVQRERAESMAAALAHERGHVPLELAAKPSFGNLLLWKTLYATPTHFHVDAVRLGRERRRLPGDAIPRLELARDLPWLAPQSQQARDVERFRRFSDGWVALDPQDPVRVIDVRYSLVPNRIAPLWGIALDPDASPDVHARFFTSRDPTPERRAALRRMLLGAP